MEKKTNARIFLVDDDPFCLSLYQQHLSNLGYQQVSVFNNGSDCLNSLVSEPDIIFLDHRMETMNGLEVLKKIKRVNPDIYVVILSSQDNISTAVSSLKYGAFDYIVKGDEEFENISKVLNKIHDIKQLLNQKNPGLVKRLLANF